MTRAQRQPARSPLRDARITSPGGLPVAAGLSIAGLVIIAVLTLSLTSGNVPFLTDGNGGTGPGGSGDPVARTATPSGVVVVPTQRPGLEIPGAFVYAKGGSIWIQAAGKATRLTSRPAGTEYRYARDSMPSFSPDGRSVYFVRTRRVIGEWPVSGVRKPYRMDVPMLMRVPTEGGEATLILDGLVDPAGSLKWMGFIREPVLSPDGRTLAMGTDLPDPSRSDVVIRTFDLRTKKLVDLGLGQVAPLGHQDPAWRPDGLRLAYVRNDREGAKGIPRIYSYNVETKKSGAITGPGYLHPSWSPDGRYLAATRTTAFGTDVAILDARTGAELLRVTSDGESWAPAWSPRGDQLAFLHVSGQVVDLRLVQLTGSAPAWTVGDIADQTASAGLDGVSRPDWFIPADQLPAPTPAPTPAATASPSVP